MSSSGALTEYRIGPLYFYDQPTNRIKEARRNVFNLEMKSEETVQSEELSQRQSGEPCEDYEPDTSSAAALSVKDRDPMDAYKRAAPHLLNDLARLLSQHEWTEKSCVPRGIVNILNRSWQDLTAGAVHRKSPDPIDQGLQKLVKAEGNSLCVEESVGPSVGKPQVSSHPRTRRRKHNHKRGWIIQPRKSSCDESKWISLCQWVVERLQVARNPEKLQTADQYLNKPLILRHYGDAKANDNRRTRREAKPATLVNGMPQIPEVKQQDPARQKLHYRINDGSSFIYYPSGCMAVCQSCSGLPCGGFYTNVFSDSKRPVILATITASGHGAVTHPLSSAITAVWDQDGGFMCDHHGSITKEWSWQTGRTMREKIVIQLSDMISVRLLSSTSAMLSFRCNNESVQLPLSALSNINQSKETACLQTPGKITSDAAQDLLLAGKTIPPAVVLESKRSGVPTPVSACSREVLQMAEGLEEQPAQWRRRGHVGRELKRLQQRVRCTLDDWLDYYRVAIGIKCPDTKRMPDAPLRTRMRREVQSAALPSLNPPVRADGKPVQPDEGRSELRELHIRLSAPAEKPLESCVKLPRKPKKPTKEEPCVTQIGPLQIHGNIRLESVIIPHSPDLQPCAVTHHPAPPSFTPSAQLTVCPALLRAALLGEGGRKRCCCSTTLMPMVTDLEYDAFVMGQPPHSQQILVVCVAPLRQPVNTHAVAGQDVLEQLYRRRNKHRTTPCTQCQMDSFRLVKYEMSTGDPSCGAENILLQQRHNTAPGMILMYIRGKLLFVGYVFSGNSCCVRDLQKQISRTRGDYRLGLSLPSDYKFSETVINPATTDARNSQDATLKGRDVKTLTASRGKEMTIEKKNNGAPEASHHRHRDFCVKPRKTPTLPAVPVTTR